jgi:hypothetical protein
MAAARPPGIFRGPSGWRHGRWRHGLYRRFDLGLLQRLQNS